MRERGQLTTGALIGGGIITAIVSLGTSWATSSVKTAVLEERQKNQYEELKGTLVEVKQDVKEILKTVK